MWVAAISLLLSSFIFIVVVSHQPLGNACALGIGLPAMDTHAVDTAGML